MDLWSSVYLCRKHGTTEWKEIRTCFGIWGLYSALDADLEMPSGFEIARMERYLKMGGHANVGNYEVRLKENY